MVRNGRSRIVPHVVFPLASRRPLVTARVCWSTRRSACPTNSLEWVPLRFGSARHWLTVNGWRWAVRKGGVHIQQRCWGTGKYALLGDREV